MATRISGKQTAARITAVVAAGSFAVAGLGFVALENAPKSDAATTKASPSQSDDTSQALGTSPNDDSTPATVKNDDSSPSPSVTPTPSTSQKSSSTQTPQVKKTVVRQKAKSTASPVKKGNGRSASGKSSGS